MELYDWSIASENITSLCLWIVSQSTAAYSAFDLGKMGAVSARIWSRKHFIVSPRH